MQRSADNEQSIVDSPTGSPLCEDEIMSEEPSDEEDQEDSDDDFIDDSDDFIDPRMTRLAAVVAGKMFERGYTPEFLVNELAILYKIISDDQSPQALNHLLGYDLV